MATNELGPSVSRNISPSDRSFTSVVFQENKPPCDAELTLAQTIGFENASNILESESASGWIMDVSNPSSDIHTSPKYSNHFYFGKSDGLEERKILWARVNGWLVPVSGTRTGKPPISPNDVDSWNRVDLPPPVSSVGGTTADFVFLEVWQTRIDVDTSVVPSTGKPVSGFLYKFGNVESGFSYLPDELVDPAIQAETTRRVQTQYRIRVVSNVGLSSNPEGFDPSRVFAQGNLSSPSSIPFSNMKPVLGDAGLWRAGTGDPSTFGTVDGFVYAIPMMVVFRRNSAGFSDSGNLAGAFNRNSVATSRDGSVAYTSDVTLQSDMTVADVSFNVNSIAGTILSTLSSFGEAYFRIDDEIIKVNSVTQLTPTNFLVGVSRGQLQSTIRSHKSGKKLVSYTVRPDGLFADQVASTDILDLRHSVVRSDYTSMLQDNVMELLKGRLKTTWKRYGSTNVAGVSVLYGDRITDGSVSVGGLTRLDGPDGNRRLYSDAVTTQRLTVPVTVPGAATVLGSPIQAGVAPYNIEVLWNSAPPIHGVGNRLSGGVYPTWWNGDQILISKAPFISGLPGSDADQVRFVSPSEDIDSIIIRFEGMTTDPNGGVSTSDSATNPMLTNPILGNRIMKEGSGFSTSIDGSGNLLITFQSGAIDTELAEFLDALQGNTTTSYVNRVVMHVEFTVLYGSGRGLSHRPQNVHSVQFKGSPTNSSKILLRDGMSDKTRMIPTYLGFSPYVQTGNDRNLARTSEVMIDPGSKSVYVAPYRNVQVPSLMARSGSQLNPYGVGLFQGSMPTLAPDGVTVAHSVVDPLDIFFNGAETVYTEIQSQYSLRPGLHHIPIIPTSNTVFSSGINFFLMSKEGAVGSTSDQNRNLVSYPSGAGYYIVTPLIGEVYGTSSGPVSMFGSKYTNTKIRSGSGGPFRGVKFPPFMAPARITGVYARSGVAVTPVSSPFDANRAFVGGAGKDVNLLRDVCDSATVLLDVDANGDLYFILSADAIDFSKLSSSATFDNTELLVECTLFGFDRGFLQTNNRVLVAKTSPGGSVSISGDVFTTNSDSKVGFVLPAPLTSTASNNELTVYYSRTPYQGDAFGTQLSHSDDPRRLGPLTVTEATSIFTNKLGPVSSLNLANKSGFEVLASTSFITSLGTGRLSGSVPIPLLTKTQANSNPQDFAGSLVDLNRKYSANRVGYEDWTTTRFPVSSTSVATRPATKIGALSEIFDNDSHPELAGCVTNLPLGSFFRDKDFVGKTMYNVRSSSGVGSISLGSFSFVDSKSSNSYHAEGNSSWEGTEYVCGSSSNVSCGGSDALVLVDGTSSTTSVTDFKTTRGGASYSASKPWAGGAISTKFPKARFNTEVGSVLLCNAYLVRSTENDVHAGDELQMVVVTQAVPGYFRDSDLVHSASGAGEGYTAVDRFRIKGLPLTRTNSKVDTSVVPSDPPLFVNKIYDDPLVFGSSDISTVAQKAESFTVVSDGQTTFTLSQRPLDPTAVRLSLRGVNLDYGVDFTVGGITNQTVTYIPSSTNPSLLAGDRLSFWYIVF